MQKLLSDTLPKVDRFSNAKYSNANQSTTHPKENQFDSTYYGINSNNKQY